MADQYAFFKGTAGEIMASLRELGVSEDKALFVVAQFVAEKGYQESVKANALFNVKGKGTAEGVNMAAATEYANGSKTYEKSSFRGYNNVKEAVSDYAAQLQKNWPGAWQALTDQNKGLADFAAGLQNGRLGRYATDPNYASLLAGAYKGVEKRYNDVKELPNRIDALEKFLDASEQHDYSTLSCPLHSSENAQAPESSNEPLVAPNQTLP